MHLRRTADKIHLRHESFVKACAEGREGSLAFVTGCFDILHAGHLDLLEEAAALAGFVAVAVNSDAYIRRMPHKLGGPYVDQRSRALLVASIAVVNAVTLFDADTPVGLIERIRPDFLVMGAEYKSAYEAATLPGSELIDRLGCKVHFVRRPRTRDLSSSAIAAKVRAQAPRSRRA